MPCWFPNTHIPPIPTEPGHPEGYATSHNSTDRGLSRHMPATTVFGATSPITSAWTMTVTDEVYPRAVPVPARIHSENGTETTACSSGPKGPNAQTINRTMITNNAQPTCTNSHKINPIPSAQSKSMPNGSRPPESSPSPIQLRSVLKTGRI